MTRKNFIKSLLSATVVPLAVAAPIKTYRSMILDLGPGEESRGLWRVLVTYDTESRLVRGKTYVYDPADLERCRKEHELRNGTRGQYWETSNFMEVGKEKYAFLRIA